MEEKKKSVSEIIIEEFTREVLTSGVMPWTVPYNRYLAFNWYSLTQYHGINRLMLPFGEYLTMKQMIKYNKENGTNYRFVKSDKNRWWRVVFFTVDERVALFDELGLPRKEAEDLLNKGPIRQGQWVYSIVNGVLMKRRNILRYSVVADRSCFVDENGNTLPSRLETGEVAITSFNAKDLFDSYVRRTGVRIEETKDAPYYDLDLDACFLNKSPKDNREDFYWSYTFHELAHSTMTKGRCNRDYYKLYCRESVSSEEAKSTRAKEECIAEIASSMVCSECGIIDFKTSQTDILKNNASYVSFWLNQIKDWGNSFIYIVSEAERAYQYIMGENC